MVTRHHQVQQRPLSSLARKLSYVYSLHMGLSHEVLKAELQSAFIRVKVCCSALGQHARIVLYCVLVICYHCPPQHGLHIVGPACYGK